MKNELQLKNFTFAPAYAWALLGVLIGSFVAAFVSLQMGVFTLFFLLLAWWVWQNPEPGLLFLIVISPLLPMFKVTQTIGTITLVKDVIILTLFWRHFVWPLCTKQLPYRRNVLFAPLVALLLWTAFSMLRADSLVLGVLRARDIVLYALLYLAVLYAPHSPRLMRERLRWFVIALLVTLVLGVYQWFFAADSAVLRFDPVRRIWIPRLSSTFGHPSVFGQYLVIASAVLGVHFLEVRNKMWRYVSLLILLGLLPFIYLTYSRAVWLGWLIAMVSMGGGYLLTRLSQANRRRIGKYAGLSAIVLVALLVLAIRFTPVGIFLRSSFDPTYASNEIRLEFLARLIGPMTNTEAIIGKGLGDVVAQTFRPVDLEAADIVEGSSRAIQLTKDSTLVDNQYLKTFVEMGLIGLLVYAWLYWRWLRFSIELTMRSTTGWGKAFGILSLGFLSAFLIQAFFIDIWDIFPTNAAFWVLAAFASQAANSVRKI